MKFILIFLVTSFTITSWSHSGGTDGSGCHTNHQTGDYHCHNPKKSVTREPTSKDEDYQVMFNTKSKKYHRPRCKSAKACTVNCVELQKSEAIKLHGVPCGNCGG